MIRRSEPVSCKSPKHGRGNGVPTSRPGTVSSTPEWRDRGLRSPYLLDSAPGN